VRLAYDMKGHRIGSAGLAMGEPGELLAVAEEKFNLEAGFVIPVERDGVQVQIGAKKEGDPVGPPVNDDHDSDVPAPGGGDRRGRFRGREPGRGKPRRQIAPGRGGSNRPYRRSGGGPTPGVGSGIEVTRIGIAPECADQVEPLTATTPSTT